MHRPGAGVFWRWWEQERIDILWVRERAATVADGEEERKGKEAAWEETTGRSRRQGIQYSTYNTI